MTAREQLTALLDELEAIGVDAGWVGRDYSGHDVTALIVRRRGRDVATVSVWNGRVHVARVPPPPRTFDRAELCVPVLAKIAGVLQRGR